MNGDRRGVSVVIPTYGRPDYLLRAIESVRAQTRAVSEIIVIDDNGDGTSHQRETADVMAAQMSTDARVRYLTNATNRGACHCRNRGKAESSGEFVAFLDDDDEWLPEFVESGIGALEANGGDVAYCDCYIVDERSGAGPRLEVNRKHAGDVWPALISGWCPSSTSLFVFRRSALGDRSMFDESLPSFQDYDCWLTLSQHCLFVAFEPARVLRHRHDSGQITGDTGKRRRGLEAIERKWMPRMTEHERRQFEMAIRQFRKSIHRTDYRNALRERAGRDAVRAAFAYLSSDRITPRDLYALLRSDR